MSDFNSKHNRAVWFDIPVRDLDRSAAFYAAVLGVRVDKESADSLHRAARFPRDHSRQRRQLRRAAFEYGCVKR
jgi:predicted enzyme related to lactoylglutathione lyase